tara:strand:- start:2063 stop:2290 length:228 start_codon:yes stop_codon:yes gene_type:complete
MDKKIEDAQLNLKTKCMLAIDFEPRFVQKMLARSVLSMGESEVCMIENCLLLSNPEPIKQILYDRFIDEIFDHIS